MAARAIKCDLVITLFHLVISSKICKSLRTNSMIVQRKLVLENDNWPLFCALISLFLPTENGLFGYVNALTGGKTRLVKFTNRKWLTHFDVTIGEIFFCLIT